MTDFKRHGFKRFGCYDKVIGNRRYYMVVRGTNLITTTQFLDEKGEHGWVREEESVINFNWDVLAYDAMEDIVKGGGWRHSDDWPREEMPVW